MSSTELINQAVQALENNDLAEARRILRQIVRKDPDNYRAWLWLAGITDASGASLEYVHRAAALAPDDPTVQEALIWAEQRAQQSADSPHPAPENILRPKEKSGGWLKWFGLGVLILGAFFPFG